MTRHQLAHGEIVHARVEDVYPTIAPGSVTLCHVDGPYGMGKAPWDKVKDLAAWYRPHIAEWGRACAPSASVYLWNTAEGWAAIHPEMVGAGWTLHVLIVWSKPNAPGIKGVDGYHGWPDVTEVCGFYVRHSAPLQVLALRAGRTYSEMARLVGCDSRLPALWEGWPDVHGSCLPTLEQWSAIGGDAREYSSLAAPFHMRAGFTNVWTEPLVANSERVLDDSGGYLHPCQKPLLFARRIVEASSRPGDLILEPFAGTARIAAACEAIGRYEPENARRYVCVEMDEDGRDYIPAVLASLRGELRNTMTGQIRMFGG